MQGLSSKSSVYIYIIPCFVTLSLIPLTPFSLSAPRVNSFYSFEHFWAFPPVSVPSKVYFACFNYVIRKWLHGSPGTKPSEKGVQVEASEILRYLLL